MYLCKYCTYLQILAGFVSLAKRQSLGAPVLLEDPVLAIYLEDNPRQLVNVGHLKIQLGLIDTNIPRLKTREPTRQLSNLEIDQIIQASSYYPKVAETLALINLVIPEAVGKGLGQNKAMMDQLNS